jgi:hypothetical protein
MVGTHRAGGARGVLPMVARAPSRTWQCPFLQAFWSDPDFDR